MFLVSFGSAMSCQRYSQLRLHFLSGCLPHEQQSWGCLKNFGCPSLKSDVDPLVCWLMEPNPKFVLTFFVGARTRPGSLSEHSMTRSGISGSAVARLPSNFGATDNIHGSFIVGLDATKPGQSHFPPIRPPAHTLLSYLGDQAVLSTA